MAVKEPSVILCPFSRGIEGWTGSPTKVMISVMLGVKALNVDDETRCGPSNSSIRTGSCSGTATMLSVVLRTISAHKVRAVMSRRCMPSRTDEGISTHCMWFGWFPLCIRTSSS
ncbi:MAG: hypothetical protein DWC07_01560 [Candidatus Poseidoniales archaeon]|nr:MAG: hypothetical protein DWC07_01560 [Candidatus Poseidoniales archaeon]